MHDVMTDGRIAAVIDAPLQRFDEIGVLRLPEARFIDDRMGELEDDLEVAIGSWLPREGRQWSVRVFFLGLRRSRCIT